MWEEIINPKKYCDFYKKLIVEELVFVENYLDYHYGNCAVIGKILKENDIHFLENIRLSCFGKNHEIPEGSIKIRLITNLYNKHIPNGKTVELHGKAVFYNINSSYENQMPITVQDLYYQFNQFLKSNDLEEKNIENLKKIFNQSLLEKYEPAIQVRFINLCDQSEDLIAYNLEIRLLTS